ncbi:MAG: S8 family serine peptidase, partial [Phycisphaerae bacterium]|nr:S8 family serine peptidase [Phycisphaerae bacterium]
MSDRPVPFLATAAGRLTCAVSVLGANLACSPAPAFGGGPPLDPAVETELIVRPAVGHAVADVVSALANAGLVAVQVADSIDLRDTFLLTHLPQPGVGVPQLELILAEITASGVTAWAEINYQAQTAEGKTDSLWVTGLGFGDWFTQQYAVQLLDLPLAHTRSRGQGVVVAILDTGVDLAHTAVEGPVAAGVWSFVHDSPDVADAGNGNDDDGDGLVDEGVGHGTFVASLIRMTAHVALLMPLQELDSEVRSNNYR